MNLSPARRPTLYFIGVTTGSSSIMRVFPEWARMLSLDDAEIKGIDLKLHDEPQNYRDVVNFIKNDPLSLGALVTTHKLDLFAATSDLFETIDPHARLMAEASCISKRGGALICHAKDPISSGLAIDGFLAADHFAKSGSDVFAMGAGGSTIALSWHLLQQSRGVNRPKRMFVSDINADRLAHIQAIHAQLKTDIPIEYCLATRAESNDIILQSLSTGSLIINATGLGKDVPGSPLSHQAEFPRNSVVWELNYRGELVFLQQAIRQQSQKALQIEDGWTYFIHGWTQVIAEVFDVAIPVSGSRFDEIAHSAAVITGRH